MDLGIAGKKAIVCGSSRGLGKGCAAALARAGCIVVVNGIDAERLSETAGELRRSTNSEIIEVAGDVTTHKGQDDLISACPQPDILITNAGGPPFKDFRELEREAMLTGVTWNMITPIELIQRCIDGMSQRGFGRILNITSVSVNMPVSGLDLSSGARAGLTAFCAGVSRSVASTGVTINHIQPGFFDTDRYQSSIENMASQLGIGREEAHQQRIGEVPAKRAGTPEEFGEAAAFLCSVHAGYITGQSLLLDGGLYNSSF
ncbi:MAG: 3-oxoacyl-ACP reductase [Rhodospirillaceae bacterium]|nr:3-oxoacyl-ACP reductase [Rhodospirillaceae bacterium]